MSMPQENDDTHEEMQDITDVIAESLPSCASVLVDTKQCYHNVLQCVEEVLRLRGATVYKAHLHHTKLTSIENCSSWLMELNEKIASMEEGNSRMRSEINGMRLKRSSTSKEKESQFVLKSKELLQLVCQRRQTLKLSADGGTNSSLLKNQLHSAREHLKEAEYLTEAKYVPSETSVGFKQQQLEAQAEKESFLSENQKLAKQLKIIRESRELAKSLKADSHGTDVVSFIMSAVGRCKETNRDITIGYSQFGVEDPIQEQETEIILNSYEKFNFLFENSMFEAAALQATSSPKGVLRTLETLERFKKLPHSVPDHKPPLIIYCEALMQSSPAYKPVSPEEAIECTICALQHDQLKTLANWISQEWLPLSAEVANVILQYCDCCERCTCGRNQMVFTVFVHCGALKEASLSLLHQGRYNLFLQFSKTHNFSQQDYGMLLCRSPSVSLGRFLIMPPQPHLPVLAAVEAILLLLHADCTKIAIGLLQDYLNHPATPVTVVMNDIRTNIQHWQYLVSCLTKIEEDAAALEVFAVITVSTAITSAIHKLKDETTQWQAVEDSRIEEAQFQSQTGYSSVQSSSHSSCTSGFSLEDSDLESETTSDD